MKLKLYLALSLVVALSTVLAACAPVAPTAPQIIKETVVVEKEVEKVVEKEKIVTPTPAVGPGGEKLADQQIVRRLERAKKSVIMPNQEGGAGRDWVRVTWLTPLLLNPDGSTKPGLAEKVEASADGMEYTLTLDPKAVFSNGNPITAAAVKRAWEWGAQAKNLPGWGGSYTILKNVEGMDLVNKGEATEASGLVAVDDTTLKIKLTSPVHKFGELLASYMLGVFDASDPVDDPDYWKKPAVSGPYQIEWDPDTGAVDLTPNPKWWRAPPIIQKVEFRIVPDAQARLIAYENDEVDMLKDTGDLTEQLLALFKDQLVPVPSMGFFYLAVNNQLPPTDDVHVRRALLMAIDREKVIKSLFPARDVVDTVLQPGMMCYDPTLEIPYDPEGARKELALSKYGSAENLPPIKIQYWADIGFWGRILTAFQEQWKENLGIQVELFGVEKYDTPNFNVQRDSAGAAVNDPSDIISKYTLLNGDNAVYQNYKPTDEMDALTRQADALPDSAMEERCKLYNQLERTLLLDEAAVWPMIGVPYRWLVKPTIKGFQTNTNQDINWDEMYVVAK